MKNLLLILGVSLGLTACMTIPPLNFHPNLEEAQLKTGKPIDAELRTITVSTAAESEKLGDVEVGFSGNSYEISFKDSFKNALEESILRGGLFNDGGDKKVSLLVKVLKFDSPDFGGVNFNTHMITRYQVIDRSKNETVYDKNISSHGSVPGSYAFVGAVRYTEARNRAVQNNIVNFLKDLKENGLSGLNSFDEDKKPVAQ